MLLRSQVHGGLKIFREAACKNHVIGIMSTRTKLQWIHMNKWIQCRKFIARQGKKSEMRTSGEGGVKKVTFKICLSTDRNDPLKKRKFNRKKRR